MAILQSCTTIYAPTGLVAQLCRPRTIRKTATQKPATIGKLEIGIECDSAPALP